MLFQGTLVNAVAVIAGSLLGLLLGRKISQRMQNVLLTALGLSSLLIGVKLALGTEHEAVIVISMVLGGVVGRPLRLEDLLEALGEYLRRVVERVPLLRSAAGSASADGKQFSVGKAFVAAIFQMQSVAVSGTYRPAG